MVLNGMASWHGVGVSGRVSYGVPDKEDGNPGIGSLLCLFYVL